MGLPRTSRIALVFSLASAIVTAFFWSQAVGKATVREADLATALSGVVKDSIHAKVVEAGYSYSGTCLEHLHNKSFTRCSVSKDVDSICRQRRFTDELILSSTSSDVLSTSEDPRRLRAHGTGYRCTDSFEPWIRVKLGDGNERCAFVLGLEHYNPRRISLQQAIEITRHYPINKRVSLWVPRAKSSLNGRESATDLTALTYWPCILGFGSTRLLADNLHWIENKRQGFLSDTWCAGLVSAAALAVSIGTWLWGSMLSEQQQYMLLPTEAGDAEVDHAVLVAKLHHSSIHH